LADSRLNVEKLEPVKLKKSMRTQRMRLAAFRVKAGSADERYLLMPQCTLILNNASAICGKKSGYSK